MTQFDYSDIAITEVPVVTPEGVKCVLREATGEASVKYRAQMMKGMNMADGKVGGAINEMASAEPLLVSLCLFYAEGKNVGKNVDLGIVKSWPNKVMKELYDEAQRISGMSDEGSDEDSEEMVGNESESSKVGTD